MTTAEVQDQLARLRAIGVSHIGSGSHTPDSDALCVMECDAKVRGKPHTDSDPDVDPIIGAYARGLNDRMKQAERDANVVDLFSNKEVG